MNNNAIPYWFYFAHFKGEMGLKTLIKTYFNYRSNTEIYGELVDFRGKYRY